ncbi:MAG TPA: bifunctional serine/threonine-protein kinase/formylglycine-generating enzyme family protein [Anaerolineales bacterium]|jgi:serine/threonine protein kinase|nr:bifunctional serine/threonine-protein kinase/formylglycine-generating enzyme family protein [Anaerolineales bacterium]
MPEWIGKTVGRVRIDKYLARGGMAEVYLGSHLTLERPVAIKFLHSYIEQDADLLSRFHREARVVAGLRHPNIVQIFDFDSTDGHPYIVMEYLKGPTLANYLRRMHERHERIPPHQVARLLKGLTAALDYAHEQGVIHRDIKPGNILLNSRADEISFDKPLTNDVEAILTDFGLVRIVDATSQTASGMVSGTPMYMSPEQARGDKTDHRTDIYSLGVVLYEMLAGRVPFEADSTMTILHMQINSPPPPIPGVPGAVQAVMNRALTKSPEERYQTSREMAVDFYLAIGMTAQAETIREALPEHIVTAAPALIKEKPVRSPVWIGVGIFSFICLLALAVGAFRLLPRLTNSIISTEGAVTEIAEPTLSTTPSVTADLPEAAGMVEIKAGNYEVGRAPADDYHSSVKAISLNGFWIDQFQTTNSQYQLFVDATSAQAAQEVGAENNPVRGVTWDQATAYCSWAKKRLPTEAEWEAAGRGPGTAPQLYPWGTDDTAGGQVSTLPNQDTYEVGTLAFNQSLSGVFDMVGNIWEWVGEPYSPVQDGFKVLRGGRFGLPVLDLAYRLPVATDDTRYVKYAGFRCAADQVR